MMEFILITGMSGGGKSQAAGILEDLGFYCVDNLPAGLIPRFAELCLAAEETYNRVALVSDVRGREGFGRLLNAIDDVRDMGLRIRILYLEASAETILNRYKETRHRHPLDPDGGELESAIQRERELTRPLKEMADLVIDTTDYPLAKLKQRLAEAVEAENSRAAMSLHVVSFGYKYGIPAEADLVLDVRFLPNPFYIPALKPLSGRDKPVSDYVLGCPQTEVFLQKLMDLLQYLMPHYEAEGKPSLMLAFGCTGGRHRSVALAESVAATLKGLDYPVDCSHRDLK